MNPENGATSMLVDEANISDAIDWYGEKPKNKQAKRKNDRFRRTIIARWLVRGVLIFLTIAAGMLYGPPENSWWNWAIVIGLFVSVGLFLGTLPVWHKLRSPGVIVAYLAGGLILVVFWVSYTVPGSLGFLYDSCLPKGVALTDIVSAYFGDTVTVQQTLVELGGHCASDGLVDLHGQQMYFYHLIGCSGADAGPTLLQNQTDEIAKLKENYTLIEMTCNPSGQPIP